MSGRRQAFSTLAGASPRAGGAARESAILRSALAEAGDPAAARELTHGFHAYPARMHPRVARSLIAALAPRGGTVLDPFCGSGTVLIEARAAGCRALGFDVNPLAVRLAEVKCGALPEAVRRKLVDAATAVAERAQASGAPARGPARRGAPRFDPHVFRELAGLRAAIDAESETALRAALELCLSAILVKVSRRKAETSLEAAPKRLARGFASRLFVGKATELAAGLAALAAAVPPGTPKARVEQGDARSLTGIPAASVDLAVTSPPYLGVYDYSEVQQMRYDWLGLDARYPRAREIGARRRGVARAEEDAYRRDLAAVCAELRRVLRRGRFAVFEVGDSLGRGGESIDSRGLIAESAAAGGLTLLAWASMPRRTPEKPAGDRRHRAAGLLEHLLLLQSA